MPPGVQQGVRDARGELKYSAATVVENRAESADGSLRTLVLSVEDQVTFLEGRTMRRRQEAPRWVDAYMVPGQFVAVCHEGGAAAQRLYALANSPYAARRDSANLAASIIEVLVDRSGCADDRQLAQLGPGALLDVSNVIGRGYASLFNSYVGLLSALEDSRNLLMIGAGASGIAPLRSALEWAPVQAHATAHRVALFYAALDASRAGYIKDWDVWRGAGVRVEPCYLSADAAAAGVGAAGDGSPRNGAFAGPEPQAILAALEEAIFDGNGGLHGAVGGDPHNAAVLISGLPGDATAALTRRLTSEGIKGERILFCEFS
ncbi:hypothetical protein WJX81_001667 [Elliptochloris bilobata]|uniref:FAD-binding FR-type domain-containing protein n=1 Tax=Elliptochloris bilobata TaxID=381761 RepID=A0AAW1S0P7_9CHLO